MKDEFLYKQLYNSLLEPIESGEYPEGFRLPAEAELKKTFGVSAITVKKALGLLAEQGLVRRVPGRGTFVQRSQPVSEDAPPAPAPSPAPAPQNLIGVVLEHIATPFGLSMMYQMDRMAEEAGYKLCIRFSYGDRKKETEEIGFLTALPVQGLIIMPSHGKHYSPTILRLFLDRFPMVLIDKKLQGIQLPSVRTDNHGAVAHLVRHLAGLGCQRIAFVSSDDRDATSLQERQAGYLDTIKELKLPHKDIHTFADDRDFARDLPTDQVIQAMQHYLENTGPKLDAIICSEYGLIPPVVRAAQAAGLSPDEDFRLCCIDEDYLSPYGYTFTHMKQDEIAIAEKSIQLLLQRIAGHAVEQEDHLIPAVFHSRPGQDTV